MIRLNIFVHSWSNRSKSTSVERMCELLALRYDVTTSIKHGEPNGYTRRLKRLSNSRAWRELPAPYNSNSLLLEISGLWQALRTPPDVMLYPYADYDYYMSSYVRPLVRSLQVLYSYFSVAELESRFKNLHHFERADCIFAAGHAQVRYLSNALPGVRVEYLPLGVDTKFFVPGEKRNDLTIIQSGINRRDMQLAFDVLDKLHDLYPEMRAEFIGCSGLREKYGDREYAFFHDYLDDNQLLAVYQRGSFQILPLWDGGSSNSLNEGYACGLPVVVTDLDNIRDYCDAGASFMIEKGDVDGFLHACIMLCEDDELRKKMSIAARRRAESLDWQYVIDRFDEVVTSLLNE